MSYLADKTYKYKILFVFFSISSILPLILMAGYRDSTIGTDTLAYPQQTLDYLQANSYLSLTDYFNLLVEPLYVFLAELSVYLGGYNLTTLLFLQHTIIIVAFYFSFIKLRKDMPIWIGMTMFCFLFYNMSLNMQRQMIAISLMFLATTYLINHKICKSMIFFIVAFFFHKTAIVAILILLAFYIRNIKWCKYSILICIIVLMGYSMFLSVIVSISYFSKYIIYQQNENYGSFFSITEFLTRILFLYLLFKIKIKRNNDILSKCVFCLFICESILNLTQIYSAFVGRIGYGLFALYCMILPSWVFCYKDHISGKVKTRKVVTTISLLFIVLTWWYVYINSNAGETYPYSSRILNI